MRLFAFLILLSLLFSFACAKEEAAIEIGRPPSPGIEKGRLDPLEERYFLKRYLGNLGDNDSIPMELLLVNWGNGRLSGHTFYPNHTGILNFEGVLNEDKSFELVEERWKERNASFSGQFYGTDSMSGTWWNIDSSSTMPFEYKEYVSPYDYDLWTGAWHLNDPWDTTILIIGGVTERKLQFAMNVYTNGYHEAFFGTADIRGTRAVFDMELFPVYRENCNITFHRKTNSIYLEEVSFPFLCGLGTNCWINGTYHDIYVGKDARLNFIGPDTVFTDTAHYEEFVDLIGPDFLYQFERNMERLEKQVTRSYIHGYESTYWKGRVRGFHREKEGIIMYDTTGNLWAATTTPPDTMLGPMLIHYFTNNPKWKRKLPPPIADWRADFLNCTVIYESD